MKPIRRITIGLLFGVMLTACGQPRIVTDYLEKLEGLAHHVEALAEQPKVCMSSISKVEERYGYLAPGKNTYLEYQFTPAEARRFDALVSRIEQANRVIRKRGDDNC
ncbi:MAG: hypothetical protein ACQEQ8_11270 [Pseudomonadota bacterium]